MTRFYPFLLSYILIINSIFSQNFQINKTACEPTSNKAALKLYAKAQKEGNMAEKRKLLNDAVAIENSFYEALFELGTGYFKQGKKDLAKDRLEAVRDICPEYSPYTHLFLGLIAYQATNYQEAIRYFEKFLTYDIQDDEDYKLAKNLLQEIKDYEAIFSRSVPFDPKVMPNVCTPQDEYLASISPDNRSFYFIRKTKTDGKSMDKTYDSGVNYVEIFTKSTLTNGQFDAGEPMPRPFNHKYNNGAATITADNKQMYFVICQNNQVEFCDIWKTEFKDNQWQPFVNAGSHINSDAWDSQPTISYDGKTLIFASNRPGGIGGVDLYISTKQDNGEWSPAVNLGPTINTPDNELTPFLHSDSQTLYFSSKGHKGLGGYDIFFSKKDEKGNWTKPRNLGKPINTPGDDVSFFVSLDGKTGFYSSDKLNGPGGLDIYTFELYETARPAEVIYVEGTVKSNDNKVSATQIEVKNTVTKEVTKIDVNQEDGSYVAIVTAKDDHILTIKQEGIAFTSKLINKEELGIGKPAQVDLKTEEIKVGSAYRLNDINFATNSYELSDKAKFIIEEFAEFLKANPTLKIAIHGHTDDIGNDNDNLILSDNRAKAVYEYLINLGIQADRMTYKGFGETKPLASNKTEKGRAQNRRTEFVITDK
ncbi:MAG: OmpA family protein [Flavobacteriales bacterium]|nr:OmpA family protein [Flavobacteriales bacterium]